MKNILLSLCFLAFLLPAHNVQSQDLQDILGQLGAGATQAVYEPTYKFDTYMQMEVSDQNNESIVYNAYLTKDGSSYAVIFDADGAQSVIVFDTKNSTMLMLVENDGEKTGFAMGIDPSAFADLEEDSEAEDFEYESFKTGNSKTLLGYQCDEYLIKDENSEVRVWSSEKLGKEVEKKMFQNQQIFGGAFTHAAGMDGMALEYDFKDLESGEQGNMKVTQIDLNSNKSISTGDYTVMSMGQ
jgi:hypothetical protein